MQRVPLFTLTKKDFRVDYYKGSGPGGQHRNKRETACRITHKETGMVSSSENSKSRERNKKSAFQKLCKKLLPVLIEQYMPKPKVHACGTLKATRTYHEARNYVKDHMTGDKFPYDVTIGKGDMSQIIEARFRKQLDSIEL